MVDIYLVFSSVTYGLKAMTLFKQNNIPSRLEKIKYIPSLRGCGYAVAVSSIHKDSCISLLNSENIKLLEILQSKDGDV